MESKVSFEQIRIFFYVPGCFLKSIRISPIAKIKNLMCTDDGLYTYIYNGNIMDSDLTFNDAGISDGKILVAIKKELSQFNNLDFNLVKLSMNKSAEFKLNILSNNETKLEYNRLNDLRNIKVEGSLKLYRKLSRKLYFQSIETTEDQKNNNLEINYEPSSTPCTDAMPILW